MPQAVPKPKPKAPPTLVQSAGKQEDHHEVAQALALKLGWVDDPNMIANDITFRDAWRYIAKMLHEHFQAAATSQPRPDSKAACAHLAVDNAGEQAAIDAALKAAFEAGKNAVVKSTPATVASVSANLDIGAAAALGKLAQAEPKAR